MSVIKLLLLKDLFTKYTPNNSHIKECVLNVPTRVLRSTFKISRNKVRNVCPCAVTSPPPPSFMRRRHDIRAIVITCGTNALCSTRTQRFLLIYCVLGSSSAFSLPSFSYSSNKHNNPSPTARIPLASTRPCGGIWFSGTLASFGSHQSTTLLLRYRQKYVITKKYINAVWTS